MLEALRSDRYKQGSGYLHILEDDTWCCLGITTDAACEDGVEIRRAEGSVDGKAIELFDANSQYLPSAVAEWLGLEDADDLQVVLDDEFFDSIEDDGPWSRGEKTWLVELNDGGVPLAVIAGLIERQW